MHAHRKLTVVLGLALLGCSAPGGLPDDALAPNLDDPFASGVRRQPTAGTLHSMARVLAAQGRDRECEVVLLRLVGDYPRYGPGYNELAELYLRNNRPDSAMTAIEKGLELRPDDGVLWNNLGMCHLMDREFDAALAAFEHAAEEDPGSARIRGNLALALGLVGRDTESYALYRMLLDDSAASRNLAVLRQARKVDDQGVEGPTAEEAPAVATAGDATDGEATQTGTEAAPLDEPDELAIAGGPAPTDSRNDEELAESEPNALEAHAPNATAPNATEPNATEPNATEPNATEPNATEPEAAEPEAAEPEATEPEATEPEATEPEATEPEATEPEATEPEATEPEATEPEATEPEATEPEATDPETTDPETTEPEEETGPDEGTEPEKGPEPESDTEPQSTPDPEKAVFFRPEDWANARRDALVASGGIVVQKHPDVEIRCYHNGRRKVLVWPTATEPIWVFGPERDYLLQPGIIAEFSEGGELLESMGDVTERPAIRPRSLEVALAAR